MVGGRIVSLLSINGKQLIPAVEKLGLCAKVISDAYLFRFRDMVAGWVGGRCGYGK